MKKVNGFWLAILAIFAVFVLIRLFGFGLEMAEDEQIWAIPTVAPNGFQYHLIPHPPLAVFVYSIAGLFGEWRLLHIVPLIFSMGIFIFIILLARKYGGDAAALIAGALLAISSWSVLASVQLDMDGSILSFFGIAATYFFLEGVERGRLRDYIICGVLCGFGLLTKAPFILFIGAFVLHSLYLIMHEKRSFTSLLSSISVYLIALAFFLAYLLFAFFVDKSLLSASGTHATNYFSGFFSQNWLNVASILAQALALSSPLLLCLGVLALLRFDKRFMLFYTIIAVQVLFYLVVITASFRPFERYWMPIIPFLVVLGGIFIAQFNLTKKDFARMMNMGVLLFGLLVIITVFSHPSLLPLYPKDIYLGRLFTLHWNFLFPFHGASGPLAFFIPFWLIPAAFVISVLCSLLLFLGKYPRIALMVLLIVGIGYNIFLSEELLFSLTAPNLNKVSREAMVFAKENGVTQPVYSYQGTGHYIFNHSGITVNRFWAAQYADESIAEQLQSSGGTVIVVDFPSATRDSPMWDALRSCIIEKRIVEKGYDLGYVLRC